MKGIFQIIACTILFASVSARADYAKGCDDPEYLQFMQTRYASFEAKNRRLLDETWQNYQRSLASGDNAFQIISDLSQHLRYSAQFEPVSEVKAKIEKVFSHVDALSVNQQIAGDVFDSFGSEKHAVGIAQAWLAYRQGEQQRAFEFLLKSIESGSSAVLNSFGPDFSFVRQLYRDGHTAPVITYINKTRQFWTGTRPDNLRYVWLQMIKAGCPVQFDFYDTIKVKELGLSVRDVNQREAADY
ncbi:hypothetical protein [Salinimonas profundi]|nr:hypothetical protein [Salinimonas profundi]